MEVGLPALLCGLTAGLLFCPGSLALRDLLAETTRAVIKDDMTQFTQNAFNLCGVFFALLLGETLGFLLQRLERLYRAVYDEIAEAKALVEQLGILAAARCTGDEYP